MKLYEVTLRNTDTGEVRIYEVEANTEREASRAAALVGWVEVEVRDTLFRSAS